MCTEVIVLTLLVVKRLGEGSRWPPGFLAGKGWSHAMVVPPLPDIKSIASILIKYNIYNTFFKIAFISKYLVIADKPLTRTWVTVNKSISIIG